MADEPTSQIVAPVVVETDDWVHSSASTPRLTAEQLTAAVAETPTPEVPETAVSAETPAPKEGEAKEDKPKQSSTDRIAEIKAKIAAETRAVHQARRERESEEAALVKLREERATLSKPKEGEAKAKPTKDDDEVPVWSKWEEEDTEDGAFDRFLVARDAAVQKKFQKDTDARQAQHEQQRVEQQYAKAHTARIDKAKVAHPDFLELISTNLKDVDSSPFVDLLVQHHEQGAELLYHFASNPDEARAASLLTPSRPVADAIMFSETPIELMSYFAQHPAECDRLSGLHPATALVALGELIAQLKSANTGSLATVPSVSTAKPPIRPVGGARTAPVKSALDAEFGPEYIRAANQAEADARKQRYL